MIVDGYPHFEDAGKRGDSGHKRRQSILGAEVDVFRGPRVVAADESSSFSRDVCVLEQKHTASGGKILLLGSVKVDRLRIRFGGCGGAVGYIYAGA